MSHTLAGNTVLLFGGQKNIAPHPVVQLGIDSNGQPQPVALDTAGRAISTILPSAGAVTDRSGTIASGGTAQDAAAANTSRKYLLFQNHSDTEMWINLGVTAVADQPSIKIVAGGSYENPPHFCPTGKVSVLCATTGKAFTCKEA